MAWAADLVLVVHSLFVAFVVLGFALIWIGHVAGWRWVRNSVFRSTHLAAITFVAIEALIGMTCPLTEIEHGLRGSADERSFIARLLHAVIFYDFPEWVFTVTYVGFAVITVLTIRWVPIERK